MKRKDWIIKKNQKGQLVSIVNAEDPYAMNWIEGEHPWGTILCTKEITTKVEQKFAQDGSLLEIYTFTNQSKFPISFSQVDVGIYTTFNDDYKATEICLTNRCHAHLCCQGAATYIKAIRMGGRAPHLGLQLLQGSISDYSIDRNIEKRSNDRGDFILHPDLGILSPGESCSLTWRIFWYENDFDFYQKLGEKENFPILKIEKAVFFCGEKAEFELCWNGQYEENDIRVTSSQLPIDVKFLKEERKAICSFVPLNCGEIPIYIEVKGNQMKCLFWGSESIQKLVEARCEFIARYQQNHDQHSPLNGGYLIYDNEENHMFYSHVDDHNGGRERVGMGALMACWLQNRQDTILMESLMEYKDYVYRELFDAKTGIVYNDISRNLDWNRLYNYPWVAVFQLELYHLLHEIQYLKDACMAMKRYYELDGKNFYAIGIPMEELVYTLRKANLEKEAEDIQLLFIQHADMIAQNGLNYPASEVSYEQSIVAPAVSYLLQVYALTGVEYYLKAAKEQIKVLMLFNGQQPDYHLYENAIRHWDGYWFGKRHRYGDTFPHYWSVLTGIVYAQYASITGEESAKRKAAASFRGCLSMFSENGRASCAMVYPLTINGEPGKYWDPWANDQDWALYYALKYQKIVEGDK